jgi:hypothetical protein
LFCQIEEKACFFDQSVFSAFPLPFEPQQANQPFIRGKRLGLIDFQSVSRVQLLPNYLKTPPADLRGDLQPQLPE